MKNLWGEVSHFRLEAKNGLWFDDQSFSDKKQTGQDDGAEGTMQTGRGCGAGGDQGGCCCCYSCDCGDEPRQVFALMIKIFETQRIDIGDDGEDLAGRGDSL